MGTALDPAVVGRESAPVEHRWTARDAMLYALAVGAGDGDPTADLDLTVENRPGHELVVLPSFGNLLVRGTTIDLGVDAARVVHAEHAVVNHRPIPAEGSATTTARVVAVADKGSGALVRFEAVAVDPSGEPLVTSHYSFFVLGAGGFGGPRALPGNDEWSEPEHAPDIVLAARTRPDQALLYRLTGDRNLLHTDPDTARRGGFDRPILHGMCSYGIAGRLLFREVLGSDPTRFGRMSGRFTQSIIPGAELSLDIWTGPGPLRFRLRSGDAVVIDRGTVLTEGRQHG